MNQVNETDDSDKSGLSAELEARFFHLSQALLCITDQDGIFKVINPRWKSKLNYTSDDLVNQSFLDIIFPDDHRHFYDHIKKCITCNEPVEFENRILHRDRSLRVLSWKVIHSEGDNLYYIGRDISKYKRSEEILSARARLLSYAMTHSLDEVLEESLNEVERLTGSQIGFYHFVDPNQKSLTLQNWSTRTKRDFCTALGRGSHYDLANAGVWTDCVKERKPVVHNDYASLPHKKGLPPGHAQVIRELVVPVMRDEKIVAILGVGNKSSDYMEQDIDMVSLFADLVWDVAERKRTEELLKSDLREKEILLRELYHRTKNNMQVISSMLRLHVLESENQQLTDFFKEMDTKILSMALVHQKLYEVGDLSHLNLKDYLEDVVQLIRTGLLPSSPIIEISVMGEEIEVLLDTAMPCGLIVNELVNNSIKYAFPARDSGHIDIDLHMTEDHEIILQISDNGVGLPDNFNPKKDGGLGFQTVFDLVEYQLDGRVRFDNHQGLCCTIVIQMELYEPRV